MEASCYASLEPRSAQLSAGGLDWNYVEWSHGEPQTTLLLLHGITSTALSWWRVGPALAEQGFRVVAPDMPGHGDTSPIPTDYSLGQTAQAIAAFAKALNLENFLLVGHSWGGANALLLAARKMLPLSKVVLVDPAMRLGNRQMVEKNLQNYTQLLGVEATEILEQTRLANPTWDECDVQWRVVALQKANRTAVEGFFLDNLEMNLGAELKQVEVPLFLFLGDPTVGGVVPPAMIETAKGSLKPTVDRLEMLQGVGHSLHREAFERFMGGLVPFLKA